MLVELVELGGRNHSRSITKTNGIFHAGEIAILVELLLDGIGCKNIAAKSCADSDDSIAQPPVRRGLHKTNIAPPLKRGYHITCWDWWRFLEENACWWNW